MRLLDMSGAAELPWTAVGDRLVRDGVVIVRHGSVDEVRALLAEWTEPVAHPHDSAHGLTIVAPRDTCDDLTGLAGFTRARLAPHTDRSLQPDPPSVLASVLLSPPAAGGDALLVDGARVLAGLRWSFPPAAIAGLHLYTDRGTTVPVITSIEALASIRYRDDRLASPCTTGEDRRIVAALREAILAATATVPLERGDGYILHNHRYLHGRTSFAGNRRLVRMLAKVTCGRLAWLNRGFEVAVI
jgi:alpha-ketoglutarate-dependent taurine dioxygenase